jgi:hypothetical protein
MPGQLLRPCGRLRRSGCSNGEIRSRLRDLPRGTASTNRTRSIYQVSRAAALCRGRCCSMTRRVVSRVSSRVAVVPYANRCRRAIRIRHNQPSPCQQAPATTTLASSTTRMSQLFPHLSLRLQDGFNLLLARPCRRVARGRLQQRQIGLDLPLHPLPKKIPKKFARIAEVSFDGAANILGLLGG